MPIAVTEEHESLRRTAQRWLETHCPPTEPRALAEAVPAPSSVPLSAELPPVWEKMAAQGWLGLHLPEEDGGQGFTLAEVAVVLEELGAALFPGPLLPTLLVSAALARHADADTRRRLLPGLADGSRHRGRGARRRRATAARDGDGDGTLPSSCAAPFARSSACRRPQLVLVPLGRLGRLVPARSLSPRRRARRRGAARARPHAIASARCIRRAASCGSRRPNRS